MRVHQILFLFGQLYSPFFAAVTAEFRQRTVNIVTTGVINLEFTQSLTNAGPALETGIRRLNRLYPDVSWRSVYLFDSIKGTQCPAVAEAVQYWLSEWYYIKRNDTDVTVFIFPGKLRVCKKNHEKMKLSENITTAIA